MIFPGNNSIGMMVSAVLALATVSSSFGRHDGAYMNDLRVALRTPHETWGRPSARGRLKVLFIIGHTGAPRDVAELAQRFEMDFEALLAIGATNLYNASLGQESMYAAKVAGTSTAEKTAELIAKLSWGPDVIVLGGIEPSWLPEKARVALFQAVADGAGLVKTSFEIGTREVWLKGKPVPAPPALLRTIPSTGLRDVVQRAANLPLSEEADLPQRTRVILERQVRTARFGLGRVVSIGYQASGRCYGNAFRAAVTPALADDLDAAIQYDYHLRTAAEAILWAGGRDSRYAIEIGLEEGAEIAGSQSSGTELGFSIRPLADARGTYTATVRVRDRLGRVTAEKIITSRNMPVLGSLPLPQLAGGVHYLDVVVASRRGQEAWAASSFRVTPSVAIEQVALDRPHVQAGEPVGFTLRLAAPAPRHMRANVKIVDAFERVAAVGSVAVTEGADVVHIEFPYPYPVSVGNSLLCSLHDDTGIVDFAWTDVYAHRQDEYVRFPSIIWGGGVGASHVDRALVRQLNRAGFTGILSGTPSHRVDLTAVPTLTNIHLGAHEGRTTAASWLVPDAIQKDSDGSIYNPAVQQHVADMIRQGVSEHAHRGVFVYNLGDENTFSREGGAGPHELPEFRRFLQSRYPDLGALNTAWGTDFADWQDVVPLDKSYADDTGLASPYHDRCAFNEDHYARFHEFAAEIVRQVDPGALVGAEGSDPGDLERTLRNLEFWSPYRDRVHNSLMLSLAPENWVGGNWWGGYVATRTLDRNEEHLWQQVLNGAANSSWFFMSEHVEGMIAPDYQYADYFERGCLPGLRLLGDGLGQQINETPLENAGVYLYHSQVSRHAADIHDEFGNPATSSEALLATLQEKGITARFITGSQVLAGNLVPERVKLLIMPVTLALGPEEAAAIRAYVEGGGRVIADIAPGILGRHAERLETPLMDELFGIRRAVSPGARRQAVETELFRCLSTPLDISVRTVSSASHQGPAEAPVLIANRVGNGQTLLLNFDAASARSTVPPEDQGIWIRLWRGILQDAGIPIVNELEGVRGEISRFTMPGLTLVGVLQATLSPGQTGTLRFHDGPHALYDLMNSRYLGMVSQVEFDAGERQSRLYALAPEPFAPPSLRLHGGVRGETVRCDIELPLPPGQRHVLRVAATDPLGRDRLDLRRHPRATGQPLTVEIPIAFNEPAGDWRFTVTDVVSGRQASGTITVADDKLVEFPGPWVLEPGLAAEMPRIDLDPSPGLFARLRRTRRPPPSASAVDPAVVIVHEVMRVASPPEVNAVLDPAWETIAEEPLAFHLGYAGPMTPVPSRLPTTMRLAYDDQALHIYVRCESDRMDRLQTNITRRDDPNAWRDDSIEIYIDPANSGIGFMKFIVTAGGAIADMDVRDGQRVDFGWNPAGWQSAATRDADGWTVEMSFPWSDLGERPADGDVWSFALLRMSYGSHGHGTVSAPGASYHNRGHHGYLHFGPVDGQGIVAAAPAISRTKGDSWMVFGDTGVMLFRKGRLESTPYPVWTDTELARSAERLREAYALLATQDESDAMAAWSETLGQVRTGLDELQQARRDGPPSPVAWADLRSRAKQAFDAADQVIWKIRLRELMDSFAAGTSGTD